MTHYIRTKNNDTMVDLEESKDDLHVVIDISNHTKIFLKRIPEDDAIEFMVNISYLQELRGAWFEVVEPRGETSLRDFISKTFEDISKRWDLCYITD